MGDLVKVDFHGDVLEAVERNGGVWVSIRRCCENLTIDFSSQLRKLKEKAWAVVVMIPTTGPDGKTYDSAMLNLDGLPLWLATVELNRVADNVRAKLELYQRQAAKVLADHFLGRTERIITPATDVVSLLPALVAETLRQLRQGQPADGSLTVRERCRQRWPVATAKQRRRVRDVALSLIRERRLPMPFKGSDLDSGEFRFDRDSHLAVIDEAIDRVQFEAWRRSGGPGSGMFGLVV